MTDVPVKVGDDTNGGKKVVRWYPFLRDAAKNAEAYAETNKASAVQLEIKN